MDPLVEYVERVDVWAASMRKNSSLLLREDHMPFYASFQRKTTAKEYEERRSMRYSRILVTAAGV